MTLTEAQLPPHTHGVQMQASESPGSDSNPAGLVPAETDSDSYGDADGALMAATTTSSAGGGQSVNTQSPYLAVNYIIALQGVYPSRS